MNTIKKMTFTCLLSLGLFAANATSNPSGRNAENATQKIQSSVSLPRELKKSGFSEKVKIIFTVDEKGNVKQSTALTRNPSLKTSVEAQFKKICFAGLSPETSYNVEIKFIVQ